MVKQQKGAPLSKWKEFRQNLFASLKKVRRILSYFKPFWKNWILIFCLSLFLSGLTLINPLIIKFLIDDVLTAKNFMLLTLLMLFFIGINIISTVIKIITSYYSQKLSQGISYNVRNQLFEHLESLHLGFFFQKEVGDILTRLSEDVNGIEQFVSMIFNRTISNIYTLIIILIICLVLNWKLTVITLLVFPFYIVSQHYYAEKLRRIYAKLRKKYSDLLSFLEERLSAIDLIQIFDREPYELAAEKQKSRRIVGLELQSTFTSSLAENAIGFLTFIILLIVLWLGSREVIAGTMTLGALIALYAYLGGLFAPIEDFAGLYTDVQFSLVSADRVFQFLDTKPAITDQPKAYELPEIRGEIAFDKVNFAYPDGRGEFFAVKDINFIVAPGETIGLVGPSGAGKTTLLSLICRFIDPLHGNICLDGFDIREIRLASLRKNIGFVRQDVILFNTTIKENIFYGNPSAPMRNIVQAARAANLDDFIQPLPHRYDTPVGVRGMSLSAGQRQRIAIARTILKEPKILLLDEAASFLDPASELTVFENILRLFRDKTKIIVTNRISTLEKMDRIFMMHSGRIIEVGTFSELIKARGDFYKFYSYQIGGFTSFERRLEEEIRKAERYRHSIYLAGIKVTNMDYLVAYWGEREVIRILEHIALSISSNIPSGSFSIEDPKHRDIYYAALPGINNEEAESIVHHLCKDLIQRFPKVKFRHKIAKSGPGISIETLMKKSLPNNHAHS
jgi:ABC-type multidrug transport system fused ATPase/permease subunit